MSNLKQINKYNLTDLDVDNNTKRAVYNLSNRLFTVYVISNSMFTMILNVNKINTIHMPDTFNQIHNFKTETQ
jgi:hypothetical protein